MSFEYITEGVPIIPVPGAPALLYDKENNNLYVANGEATTWFLIGTGGSGVINDSVQNITSSEFIGFDGATNTFIKATAGVSGITLTLPDAVGVSGQQITVKMIDAGPGTVTIVPNPGSASEEFIDNGTSYILSNQYQAVTLESDNSNWFVRSTNLSAVSDTVFFFSTDGAVDFSSNSNIEIQGTGGSLGILIILPNAVGNAGRKVSAIKVDSGVGSINLEGQGGQQVNNGFGYVLQNQYQSVIMQSDGYNWFVFGSNG